MEKSRQEFLSSREGFERHFYILEELLRNGRMSFTEGSIKSVEGLQKVRKLSNGRIDFHTVNEMARLSANSAANFENMKYEEHNEKK
ncbi:AVAST type 1 anti-phage system protein Avs1c [Flavobacterium sp. WG21]|uniref:AVAST type 1 anti-phage system protein Avs1c n=1 Tax=Flavobacterium sp. WG21 TaxID=1229487 RepID=UPI00035CC68C|nr:AVAST type 1 anti-phage system protein Avs1c [Flavobacterium sp. WG21]